MSDFIPNSFQTPNTYVDEFMHLLTAEEYKVLSYAVRRIFGFNKRSDRISLSQFAGGATYGDELRDYGTGLHKDTVSKALESLIQFSLIEKIADNDIRKNEGACYRLQLDSSKVDRAGLERRQAEKVGQFRKRNNTEKKLVDPAQPEAPVLSARTANTRPKPQDTPVLSARTPPSYGLGTQYTVETQKKSRERAPAQESTDKHLPAIQIYVDAYGSLPNLFAQGRIENEVKDLDVWRRVVLKLRTNGTPPKNVGTLLEAYADEVRKAATFNRCPPNAKPLPVSTETPEQKQARLARISQRQSQQRTA